MKYRKLIFLFSKLMRKEMKANEHKGNNWRNASPMDLVLQTYYHVGKLQKAVKENDLELIKEFTADVANMSMMVLDSVNGFEVRQSASSNTSMSSASYQIRYDGAGNSY